MSRVRGYSLVPRRGTRTEELLYVDCALGLVADR